MKKFYVLWVLLYTITLGYSQKKFAPQGAEWKYESSGFSYVKYNVTNEIMIGDKDCSVITAFEWQAWFAEYWDQRDSIVVWEDNNQVFFYQDSTFYLMFDFNAVAGDTVQAYIPGGRYGFSYFDDTVALLPYYVISVEPIISGTDTLKRFITYEGISIPDYPWEAREDIVENIGSMAESLLFGDWGPITAGESWNGGFVCYRSERLNYDSGYLNCDRLTNTSTVALSQIKIYPNPAQSILQIEGLETLHADEFQLLNATGQVVKSGQLQANIDIHDLPEGLYFLQFMNQEKWVGTSKIMVQR